MDRKDAIEIVRKNYPHVGFSGSEFETALRELVPELKESEDERIRTRLIALVESFGQGTYKNEMLAYLEKQKDRKSKIDACGFPLRDEGESACSYLERCLAPDMRHVWYEACAEIKEKQKEQKPSAESVLIKAGLKPFKDGNQWCVLAGDNIQEGVCGFGDTIEDALYEFLKEVCEQQKPAEWSEEDKKMLNNTLDSLKRYQLSMPNFQVELQMRWLKSLRPQPHWKPSEEQMNALKVVARGFPTDDPDAIDSLLTDLQKLL